MKKVSLQSPLKQKLFHFALKCARDVHRAEEYSKPVPLVSLFLYKVLDNIVFSSVRTAMGGNVKFMASGGAAVSLPVLEFFEDIGVPICEGYGLTETCKYCRHCDFVLVSSAFLSPSHHCWCQQLG